jgi:hypothetical protein
MLLLTSWAILTKLASQIFQMDKQELYEVYNESLTNALTIRLAGVDFKVASCVAMLELAPVAL